MSETVEDKTGERPEAGERVQDALVEITALLRKARLVEGLVHEQLEHAPVTEGGNRDEDEAAGSHRRECKAGCILRASVFRQGVHARPYGVCRGRFGPRPEH